ncbi:MAG: FkbM family methyltransferase [Magnetococcus sp. YQC-5]
MKTLKRLVTILISGLVWILGRTVIGRYFQNQVVMASMEQTMHISHRSLEYVLTTPNTLCHFRAESFSTKEPETLEWIDGFPERSVLWDVGANIGLYSVYAAKERGCEVWAFEPSVFNLECLARNTFLNQVVSRVYIVPLALNDKSGPNTLNMTSKEWGGALSTFGKDYGWDGKKMDRVFSFQTFGLSMDDALEKIGIPQPDYIKMDVDGIEHLILSGGIKVLHGVKGLLIEVNDDFLEQAGGCKRILEQAGLVLKEKRHSDMISSSAFSHAFNQIWIRP